jgi:hypothetical protein
MNTQPLAAQPWFWMVRLFFPFFPRTNYRTTDNFTPVKNIRNSDINTMVPRNHSELRTGSYLPVLFQKGKDFLVHKQVTPFVANVKIIWGRCYLWLCKRAKITEMSGTGSAVVRSLTSFRLNWFPGDRFTKVIVNCKSKITLKISLRARIRAFH